MPTACPAAQSMGVRAGEPRTRFEQKRAMDQANAHATPSRPHRCCNCGKRKSPAAAETANAPVTAPRKVLSALVRAQATSAMQRRVLTSLPANNTIEKESSGSVRPTRRSLRRGLPSQAEVDAPTPMKVEANESESLPSHSNANLTDAIEVEAIQSSRSPGQSEELHSEASTEEQSVDEAGISANGAFEIPDEPQPDVSDDPQTIETDDSAPVIVPPIVPVVHVLPTVVEEAPWKVPRREAFAEKLRARITAKRESKPEDSAMLGTAGLENSAAELEKTVPIIPQGEMWDLMDMSFEAPLEIERDGFMSERSTHDDDVQTLDSPMGTQAALAAMVRQTDSALNELGPPVEEAWWACVSAMD